jgi:AraC-like DNA-binding protein
MRFAPIPEGLQDYPYWPPLIASTGRGSRSAPHAHHAMHVVLARAGSISCTIEGETISAPGFLTAPDVLHQLDASGAEVLLVFIDPESAAGVSIRPNLKGAVHSFGEEARSLLVEGSSPESIMKEGGSLWCTTLIKSMGAIPQPPKRLHSRVKRVLDDLRQLGPGADNSLESLARRAGLSEGRFMHIFTESVGIPIRRYLAWRKLQRAAAAIVFGMSATEAAHIAGFSDSAHLTKSFRQMLGMRPSDLQGIDKTAS